MKKILVSAGAVAALAFMSAPAAAASSTAVSASANAKARIYRPLKLTSSQDLDFATIVLSGTGTYTANVAIAQDGTLDCDGSSGNVTCSGTTTPAKYTVVGTNNQTVTITAPATVTLNGSNGGTVDVTLDAPPTVALGASGNSGVDFYVGGTLAVADTTTDGVYTASFDVSADYQ